jgi:site-specific DNA recombinase
VSGVLFYKVDRAARNLFDYVELERLESECGIRFISVSQPTENTPAGRMQRRVLASMASFYTEQQSLDVREGLARRVQSGLFVSHAPYGYQNVRIDGRSIIEVDPENGPKIRRIFDLYAYKGKTLDNLGEALVDEGITYCESLARFTRSKLHTILHDRAYIGEVRHKGKWHPGTHPPLVDRTTWDRTQKILGQKLQRSHEMTYAGELIECGHCGGPITGECKRKPTRSGEREYVYYRCSNYNRPGHPRIRLKEAQVESQVFALFDSLRVEDDEFRQTFGSELRKASNGGHDDAVAQAKERQRELDTVRDQQKRLLNLRMMEEIEADTFAAKSQELRDREAELKMLIDFADRDRHEIIDLAVKAFELSQSLRERWVTADFLAKRKMLEIVCLNWKLVDVTLVPTTRKPFDLLIEGPPKKESRGDRT